MVMQTDHIHVHVEKIMCFMFDPLDLNVEVEFKIDYTFTKVIQRTIQRTYVARFSFRNEHKSEVQNTPISHTGSGK